MHEENEEYRGDKDAYIPGPVTFTDLYRAYLQCLSDPATAQATRGATEQSPQLPAASLKRCRPFDR